MVTACTQIRLPLVAAALAPDTSKEPYVTILGVNDGHIRIEAPAPAPAPRPAPAPAPAVGGGAGVSSVPSAAAPTAAAGGGGEPTGWSTLPFPEVADIEMCAESGIPLAVAMETTGEVHDKLLARAVALYTVMYKKNGVPAAMIDTIVGQVKGQLETVPNMGLKSALDSMKSQIPP